jgi:hypothetical protein
MGDLLQLQVLSLYANSLDGTLPPSLSAIAGMVSFIVGNNFLTGSIPVEYCAFTQLLEIALDGNSLTSTIPTCLVSNCVNLIELSLHDNQMDGPIPASVWHLPSVRSIALNDNAFSGTISDFTSERLLSEIDLVDNYLTGSIPDAFRDASAMQVVFLRTNLFSGRIPESLGTLVAAETIQLDFNMFTGSIPGLTGLDSILQLSVSSNYLSGSLDGVFDASTQVAMLNVLLNGNQLTGTLPDELFLLPQLNAIVGTFWRSLRRWST